MVNKLIRLLKKQEKYQVKDLYVGEIVSFYAKVHKNPKDVNLTLQAKKLAILTPVNLKTLSFKSLKTNQILQPVDLTTVGNFALNDKTVTPLKNFCPELLKELNLTENSKLTKSKIIKLEDYLNNYKLISNELKL